MIEWIVLIPLVSALACVALRKHPSKVEAVALAGALLSLAAIIVSASSSDIGKQPATGLNGFLFMDSLGLLFTATTGVIAFFAILYSRGYMREEIKEKVFGKERLWGYYALLLTFLASMFLVTLAGDLLTIWAALEATTLTSVFLISFYGKKESVEAAWKYFIICSLGITIALVGLLFIGYGLQHAGLPVSFALKDLLVNAGRIDPLFLKLAFAFIIVGYGTKMGLVPLHVWLPDAHSQAPTPVSALLSGVLLSSAFYAIIRLYPIMMQTSEVGAFTSTLFTVFGIVTLALASLRLYSQENYKRLLAYSSVENMGIISLAVGIGGPLGLFAALFHMVSHALVKPLAFFMGGILSLGYGTKEISKIGGAAQTMPAIGQLFVLVNIGVAGSIPFGTFISEIVLLAAALAAGKIAIAILVVVFTTIAFGTLLLKSSGMAFGPVVGTTHNYSPELSMKLCVWGLFLLAAIVGLFAPTVLAGLVNSAVTTLVRVN